MWFARTTCQVDQLNWVVICNAEWYWIDSYSVSFLHSAPIRMNILHTASQQCQKYSLSNKINYKFQCVFLYARFFVLFSFSIQYQLSAIPVLVVSGIAASGYAETLSIIPAKCSKNHAAYRTHTHFYYVHIKYMIGCVCKRTVWN